MATRTAVIIGAGPAGLTAAWELLDRTDVVPLVLEATEDIGGISKTACYRGNRIDIGGHRFFSKSDRVMDWWLNILPRQGAPARDDRDAGRSPELAREVRRRKPGEREPLTTPAPDPEKTDEVMLLRERLSRIFWRRRFFRYPVTLEWGTLRNLGPWRTAKVGASYVLNQLRPRREERSLEDFFINRFGPELYRTFFRDYTQKVWGVHCSQIKPEWGAQRVKGLSVTKALLHAAMKPFRRESSVGQKGVETSLIERFLYPKLGPGQMWESVAEQVRARGGDVRLGMRVTGVNLQGSRVASVTVVHGADGRTETIPADWVFSSAPIQDLVRAVNPAPPENVRSVAEGLVYRDFVTVGLLVKKLTIRDRGAKLGSNGLVPDNWIYIQESDVRIGRLQVFNNWSPYLVRDPSKVWLGLEYFCNEGDDFWRMTDDAIKALGVRELAKLGIIDAADVEDACVLRVPKAYPAYFGTYERLSEIREFLDPLENLFLVGRNGMHRYNNQDHSMLTAMVAVDNIAAGVTTKSNVWDVNVEGEYHEQK